MCSESASSSRHLAAPLPTRKLASTRAVRPDADAGSAPADPLRMPRPWADRILRHGRVPSCVLASPLIGHRFGPFLVRPARVQVLVRMYAEQVSTVLQACQGHPSEQLEKSYFNNTSEQSAKRGRHTLTGGRVWQLPLYRPAVIPLRW